MKKITEVTISSLKSTFLSHNLDDRKKMLDKFMSGFELYKKNTKKKNKSTSFNSDVYDFIEWAQNNFNENTMKKSELRKLIREILLKEVSDPSIKKEQLLKDINKLSVYVDESFRLPDSDSSFWRDRNDEIDWKKFNDYEKYYVNALEDVSKKIKSALNNLNRANKQ